MIAGLRGIADRVLGRGEAAITVPPFDGALKPNQLLEDATVVAELEAPEDLASDGHVLFASNDKRLLRFDGAGVHEVQRFDSTITALATLPDGGLAVALDGREISICGGERHGKRWTRAAGKSFCAVNALSVTAKGKLLATDGSATQPYDKWCHDLMALGHSGRLYELDPAAGSAREIASGLSYAFGVCAAADECWVSESWRHRLLRYGTGTVGTVFDRLPGYPSRITPATTGGFWLSVFAARTQLVEFVLRETTFRKRMMAEIDPEYWIAPALSSGRTFLEPMQGAHIKTMGILKPWAPPRSYGLVIRLSPEGLPRYSLHSRVDGKNHGVVTAVECAGKLYALAKGTRRLLRLTIADVERELLP